MPHLSQAELTNLVCAALEANNTSKTSAASVAHALVLAEIDGRKGHGLSRVASYAAQAKAGKVDGFAEPVLSKTAAASLLVDVAHGFAYPAFDLAHPALGPLAQDAGIAMAGFTRSHHYGVAGHQVERAADAGFVAMAFGNTPSAMAPWGGKSALFGTNPIAFAVPRVSDSPLVIDLALSTVARGNVMKAAQNDQSIPEGWAFDADGNSTTDAKAALTGTMAPAGGAKGAALALMVELLAAGLTDSHYAYEASSFLSADGPPPGVGQLLMLIDPGAFGQRNRVLQRMEDMCAALEAEDGARVPGAGRTARRTIAEAEGVAVDDAVIDGLKALAQG
ncbi:MAG: Ldh family oxidoreductase [Pseudomonadota bacterium]